MKAPHFSIVLLLIALGACSYSPPESGSAGLPGVTLAAAQLVAARPLTGCTIGSGRPDSVTFQANDIRATLSVSPHTLTIWRDAIPASVQLPVKFRVRLLPTDMLIFDIEAIDINDPTDPNDDEVIREFDFANNDPNDETDQATLETVIPASCSEFDENALRFVRYRPLEPTATPIPGTYTSGRRFSADLPGLSVFILGEP